MDRCCLPYPIPLSCPGWRVHDLAFFSLGWTIHRFVHALCNLFSIASSILASLFIHLPSFFFPFFPDSCSKGMAGGIRHTALIPPTSPSQLTHMTVWLESPPQINYPLLLLPPPFPLLPLLLSLPRLPAKAVQCMTTLNFLPQTLQVVSLLSQQLPKGSSHS